MSTEDEPPPYSEVATNGSVSVDEGAGVNDIRRWDVQTNRPSTASTSDASTASSKYSRPGQPPPDDSYRPPPGPPPRPAASSSASTHRPPPGPPPSAHKPPSHPPSSDNKLRPPAGRPLSTHSTHSSHSTHSHHSSHSSSSHRPPQHYHQQHYNQQHYNQPQQYNQPQYNQPQYNQQLPPQWMPGASPPQQNPHLRYPPGYVCEKCHNTGIKIKKGTTCKDCYERFGVRTQMQYLPPGMMPAFPVPPRVVRPGDPSIGGALCGRCRGSGIIRDLFIFEDTCPVCRGVGRVF